MGQLKAMTEIDYNTFNNNSTNISPQWYSKWNEVTGKKMILTEEYWPIKVEIIELEDHSFITSNGWFRKVSLMGRDCWRRT